ncbi:MAG: hypothetical protein GYB40_19355 [Vibrionaceae bacterium]|nr:hypothetical protein [Vibrionaceae bacterium]
MSKELDTEDIGEIVNKLIHRLSDLDATLELFVPKAIDEYNSRLDKAEGYYKQFKAYKKANPDLFLESDNDLEVAETSLGGDASSSLLVCDIQEHEAMLALKQASKIYKATLNSDIVNTLNQAIFLNSYSIWDAFTGELLSAVYRLKPELYSKFQKSVSFELVMQANSIDEIKKRILEDDIENFRRDSYIEQFKSLEKRFGFETLRQFELWETFVEFSQKRNIVMHCNGVVSEQYISICKSVGIKESNLPTVGEKVELSTSDVVLSNYVMCVTGVMLAHTIWNKVLPKNRTEIDDSLSDICFDLLCDEKWHHSVAIGEFITNNLVAKDDATSKINIINLAIGYEALGKEKQLNKTLKSVDWSLLTLDFRLAEAVLLGEFPTAAKLMKKIGVEGDFVKRQSYHEWPLFHKFRDHLEFISAYKEIYKEAYFPSTSIDVEAMEALEKDSMHSIQE